jgi:hypothetical protein
MLMLGLKTKVFLTADNYHNKTIVTIDPYKTHKIKMFKVSIFSYK